MRAIQFDAPRSIKHVDVSEPAQLQPHEALVRTHCMGICGTDFSCYLGKFPFFDFPRIPGHELGVEVLEVGGDVTNVAPGDRCSVEPYINCGTCYACTRDNGNCCENLKVIGVMMDGGLCERFKIRADKLHRSATLNYDQLSLVETLAIGYHACERGAPQEGDHVLIIGGGPIGLATLEFVRLTGAQLSVMDMNPTRLEFCRKNYGIENLIPFVGDGSELEQANEITSGNRYQLVVDATGNHRSMSGAFQYCSHTGTLVYVGITSDEVTFAHPVLHRPEITLKASRNALPGDFGAIIKLIESGTINTDPWITHRTSFDEVGKEFDSFLVPENNVLKAVIEL